VTRRLRGAVRGRARRLAGARVGPGRDARRQWAVLQPRPTGVPRGVSRPDRCRDGDTRAHPRRDTPLPPRLSAPPASTGLCPVRGRPGDARGVEHVLAQGLT